MAFSPSRRPGGWADHVGEAPFGDVDPVVLGGEQPAAADPGLRQRQVGLLVRAQQQLVDQPARDPVALGRVDEAEVQEVHQQHLPILLHVGQQPLPVDPLALAQDQMGDVGAVVAVPVLQQRLGPDHLGRRGQLDRHAVELGRMALLEPVVGDA